MLRIGRSLAVALLLAAAGCSTEAPNPFAGVSAVGMLRRGAALVFTSNAYSTSGSALREVMTVDADGSGVSRITFCNSESSRCDNVEAAPSPDGQRFAVRRITEDTNRDGRLSAADDQSVFIVDAGHGREGRLMLRWAPFTGMPSTTGPSTNNRFFGIDWSPADDLLLYSANGEGGAEDLFRTIPRPDPDLAETRNLTTTAGVRERAGRIDPAGTIAVYERIEDTGKSQIWVFQSAIQQSRVSAGGPGSDALAGTPYVVGSDADPDFSPDRTAVVYRRLTGTGNGGLGTWDILQTRLDGGATAVVASGPAFRSAPDWSANGIVFSETDRAGGMTQLVVVQADGSGRRVLASFLSSVEIAYPRWIPRQ
jgi:Tol biopolymer transport system component